MQKNKEFQLQTNERLTYLNDMIKELSAGTTKAMTELKQKLDVKEPEGHVEVDILERQKKMMNPIKRALLAKLDSQPLSNISEPRLQSEKVQESSDEEEPNLLSETKSLKSNKDERGTNFVSTLKSDTQLDKE